MAHKDSIYLEVFQHQQTTGLYALSLESYIVWFVYKNCQPNALKLTLVETKKGGFQEVFLRINGEDLVDAEDVGEELRLCRWPVVALGDGSGLVAGLCAVCRHVARGSASHRRLLGFRESCLAACAESSPWTQFCEADILRATRQLLTALKVSDQSMDGQKVNVLSQILEGQNVKNQMVLNQDLEDHKVENRMVLDEKLESQKVKSQMVWDQFWKGQRVKVVSQNLEDHNIENLMDLSQNFVQLKIENRMVLNQKLEEHKVKNCMGSDLNLENQMVKSQKPGNQTLLVHQEFKEQLNLEGKNLFLPEELARFEHHLSEPVRAHNVYKLARQACHDKALPSGRPLSTLPLDHAYAEGCQLTLADLLLFACYRLILPHLQAVDAHLPLTSRWYRLVTTHIPAPHINALLETTKTPPLRINSHQHRPTRFAPITSKRSSVKAAFTTQSKLERALLAAGSIKANVRNVGVGYGPEVPFDWANLRHEATPEGGALPAQRSGRKREQLASLAGAVLRIVAESGGRSKVKIADLCSGGGHLGILLAALLPHCDVLLVENKERSLDGARRRVAQMQLRNVRILQCNLEYFQGPFDIGVALHACGLATDLVIELCVRHRAHVVCCPCCYGGVRDGAGVAYPRSSAYRRALSYDEYVALAHAADQTHDAGNSKTAQGFRCMDVVDADRGARLQECGYEAFLGKLTPTSCTPKNNLLVGICKRR